MTILSCATCSSCSMKWNAVGRLNVLFFSINRILIKRCVCRAFFSPVSPAVRVLHHAPEYSRDALSKGESRAFTDVRKVIILWRRPDTVRLRWLARVRKYSHPSWTFSTCRRVTTRKWNGLHLVRTRLHGIAGENFFQWKKGPPWVYQWSYIIRMIIIIMMLLGVYQV